MSSRDFRALFLPYCLIQQKDGAWTVVNRKYKPVGMLTDDFVDYEKHSVRFKGLTPRVAAKIAHDGPDGLQGTERIYLYDDGSVPTDSAAKMKAYLARLAILAKLQVAEAPEPSR